MKSNNINENKVNMEKISQTSANSISIFLILILSSIIPQSECLFEDQIGKFDWTQRYLGKLQHGVFDERTNHVYITTKENVLASVNAETGAIVWRQIFERGERGTVHFLHLVDADADFGSFNDEHRTPEHSTLVTVSGNHNLYLIRGWNARNGNVLWEWTISAPATTTTTADDAVDPNIQTVWYYETNVLYQSVIHRGSHIDVTAYPATGGQPMLQPQKIDLTKIPTEDCLLIPPYLACKNADAISIIDISTVNEYDLVENLKSPNIEMVQGKTPLVLVDDTVHDIISSDTMKKPSSTIHYYSKSKSVDDILVEISLEKSALKVQLSYSSKGDTIATFDVNYPAHLDRPKIVDVNCRRNRRDEPVCRILLATENGATLLLQSGKIKWIREDSLANIAAIEIVDLPLADSEGTIEDQLNNKNGNIISDFLHRITNHLAQVGHLLHVLFDMVGTGADAKDQEITRDDFGLHVMIVVVTSTGKLFGIDNISGKHHYVTHLPNFSGFNNNEKIRLVVQRSSKHFPHRAQCLVISRHKNTGNGIIYQFDPITGTEVNGGTVELNYEIKQLSVLQPGDDFLKGVLLLDRHDQLHVIPESASEMAKGTYIYTADKETGIVSGYFVEENNKKLEAVKTWQINLSGTEHSQKIITIASKNPVEHVHSQGRVLNDRSVLYKYINPNLVAFVTQGLDNVYKYVVNVHLVDVVSGGVVATIAHRRARGPINIVHSENWLVYTYFNDKVRRTEIMAIELYEGNTQANSTVWSSLDAPPLPVIEQQAYILPANVLTLKETITEKGITNKHILIALSSGGILEMPWHLLDPRRPILGTNQPREEGTIPYLPELPLSSESIINYNQSLARIDGIYTSPSGLESTCLVVAYGLDFYVTRVAPSKTYDLLKDDFDYFLISSVLIGLIVASFVVKQMSMKKALKQAWK